MTRILLVETASPKRICQTAEQILQAGVYAEPEVSVLCREKNSRFFLNLTGVKVYPLPEFDRRFVLGELNQEKFDVVYCFWTGEKQYRWTKILALRLKAGQTVIAAGDGNEFAFTWKALCRHAVFRLRHPLPTDHYDFVMPREEVSEKYDGERILVIQSAEPIYVLNALEQLKDGPLFRNPRYTVFCRNRQEVVESFQGHPMLHRVLTHSETRGSWWYLRNLRRQRFDAVVLFMTGDPSYRKIKLFAFLLGVPWCHMLVFNETTDCFFFDLHRWRALVARRIRERQRLRIGPRMDVGPQWGVRPYLQAWYRWCDSARILVSPVIKLVFLPFRFLWLLLVWFRLRFAGLRASRKNHDYSIRLPLFPGV